MANTANEQQLEAINCTDRTILCLAGAGSGKSFCLVNRIARLVNDGVNPRSILALTFTNAAAFEMAEKYRRLTETDNPIQPEFRTFHGFAYSVLVREPLVRQALGYAKVPDICEDAEFKRIQTDTKLKLKCKLSDEQLKSDGKLLTRSDKHMYELYHKAIRKELRCNNLITFDLLNSDIADLFASKADCITRFHNQYKHILVDEFQDTDGCQMKFLNSFPSITSFFCVGDALQSIYKFRGTDNRYIKMLSTNPDWKNVRLYKNYRSTRQICDFANRMSTYGDKAYRIEMEGQRDGDDVEIIWGACSDYNNPVDDKHVDMVIKSVKYMNEDGAILCRTNKEVDYMCERLKESGITYVRSNKTSDDKDLLKSVTDNEYMLDWLSTFLESSKYADYIRHSAQEENPDIRWFLNTYGSNTKIKPKATKIIDIRKILASGTDQIDKFNRIVKLIKSTLPVPKLDEIDTNLKLVDYLINTVQEAEENRLYVGTIHSSKGLEYGHVFLMGVGDRSFPIDTEDDLNLYYVGITRAKNHLTIFKG